DRSRGLGTTIESLPPREREVLRLRFGLDGEEALTLEEVGARFSVTRERARQLEAQALRRLGRSLAGECSPRSRNSAPRAPPRSCGPRCARARAAGAPAVASPARATMAAPPAPGRAGWRAPPAGRAAAPGAAPRLAGSEPRGAARPRVSQGLPDAALA